MSQVIGQSALHSDVKRAFSACTVDTRLSHAKKAQCMLRKKRSLKCGHPNRTRLSLCLYIKVIDQNILRAFECTRSISGAVFDKGYTNIDSYQQSLSTLSYIEIHSITNPIDIQHSQDFPYPPNTNKDACLYHCKSLSQLRRLR
jgi:hypothetical protein